MLQPDCFLALLAVSPKPLQSLKAVEFIQVVLYKPSVPEKDSFNGCVLERNVVLHPFCLPDIFYLDKPCCVLLKQHLSGIACFSFQVICLYGACSVLTAAGIIQASARFLRQVQVRTMSLSPCFSVLFIAVYSL